MKKTVFSLALATFGLGMAEFGIMGVLTELANNVGISIPSAGHMISAYAAGVVIGAPIMAMFSNRFSLKNVLLFLVALCFVGNTIFTFSSAYPMLVIGRLISGFPHGAIFGVGAIILSKIAPPSKVTMAVAGMIAGMTVANLIGIPLGTWIGHLFSWRYTFVLISLFFVLVMVSVIFWVPSLYDTAPTRLSEQFHFLKKPEPWLIFAATMFGNAGVFAWFSYVKPFMVSVSGFSQNAMTLIMMLMGLGMVLGNMFSGKLSARFSPIRIAAATELVIMLAMVALFFLGDSKAGALSLGFICCAGLFALSAPLQIMLLQNAKGGEMLGAAGGQMAFNFGNAVGAWFGGLIIAFGFTYDYLALPAVVLTFAALASLLIYNRRISRHQVEVVTV